MSSEIDSQGNCLTSADVISSKKGESMNTAARLLASALKSVISSKSNPRWLLECASYQGVDWGTIEIVLTMRSMSSVETACETGEAISVDRSEVELRRSIENTAAASMLIETAPASDEGEGPMLTIEGFGVFGVNRQIISFEFTPSHRFFFGTEVGEAQYVGVLLTRR